MCVCSCAHSACTPPLLAGLCGLGVCARARVSAAPRQSWPGCWVVCVRVPAPLVPRHSWLGCVVWVGVWARVSAAPRHSWLRCWALCVFVCPLCLFPATPGWGVWCVCVCVWARVSAAPRHFWLGCLGVCVFVCALRLYPATPGWVVGVCVCVLGLGFWLRPATPGRAVGVCVCSCARSPCTRPLLVEVCGVGVCAWARGSAAPRHSWLGCSGVCVCLRAAPPVPRHSWLGCVVWVCVLGLGFRLCPATPGWGVGVCVFVCALCLYPATPGWGLWCGCVCLGLGFCCPLPLLAWVLGCVCVCVPAPLVPRHSWLGCVVWLCVLGLGFRLRPATPGWVVVVCVCLCARSVCTPPLLAGVCGVGVCAWAPGR